MFVLFVKWLCKIINNAAIRATEAELTELWNKKTKTCDWTTRMEEIAQETNQMTIRNL